MKLIDEGEPFEDQYTYQLSIGNIKLKVDKEQNVLNKEMEKRRVYMRGYGGKVIQETVKYS